MEHLTIHALSKTSCESTLLLSTYHNGYIFVSRENLLSLW